MFAFILAFIVLVIGIVYIMNKKTSPDNRVAASILTGILVFVLFFFGLVHSAKAQGRYSYVPDKTLTPGVVASKNVTEVCQADYPSKSRHVTPATKKKVYKLYNVDTEQCVGGCKIDHLVPIAIGGSNDVGNLWPHEYGADRNVFMKTRLEVRLRKEVCKGNLNIEEAQQCIATDWPKCFDKFYPGVYKK